MITASHNPWTDNGFKVKSPSGAAAGPDILAVIEAPIAATTAAPRSSAGRSPTPRPPGWSSATTRTRATSGTSGGRVDLDALKAADISVLVEPMWGAGAGWIPRLLAGGRIRVTEIHQERNPCFGGVNPEPIRPNIDEALGILAGGGYDLGLLLDGDADRAGAADEQGTFIHQLEVTGLLMYYLAEHRGLRQPVVVERQQHVDGGPARRALRDPGLRDAGRVQVHRPQDDRDRRDDGRRGVGRVRLRDAPARARRRSTPTCCCSTCSCARRPPAAGRSRRRSPTSTRSPARRSTGASTSTSRATRTPSSSAGCSSSSSRTRRPSSPASRSSRTQALDTNDGFKFFVADGSWLLVRTSGTEPLVRVYTEATSRDCAGAMLEAGERLVRGS